ncbi:MAG: hypothetical protein KF852_09830 [Saprospiraceae bacterium]|nr:hypothetical protein [Saprospiraceae bacterium]
MVDGTSVGGTSVGGLQCSLLPPTAYRPATICLLLLTFDGMNRQELIETAILGLDRRGLPSAATDYSLSHDDDAGALLRALAAAQFAHKAAYPLEDAPVLPPADEGTPLPLCPAASVKHLSLVLNGRYLPALDEFLDALAASGFGLPPEILPNLLHRASKDDLLAKKVMALAGSRGVWLARQHPEWRPLVVPPDPDNWHIAALDERTAILRYLRSVRPDEGIALLRSTWHQDSVREQQALLREMSEGLSLQDEPFLEACLDSPRKEIRQAASRLLSALSGTALSERLFSYLQSIFHFKENNQWEMHFPADLPTAWQRDGIESLSTVQGGVKASLLRQLFARIDPVRLESLFSTTPEKIIMQFEKSDWSAPVFEGLTEGITLCRNTRWADALARHFNRKMTTESQLADKIAHLVSPAVFDEIVLNHLRDNGGLLEGGHVAVSLLLNRTDWSEPAAPEWINGFKQALYGHRGHALTHYRRLLREGAYHCPPHLFDVLQKDWPTQSDVWRHWEAEVGYFLQCLSFRREMRAALQRSNS